ncbi:putative phage protein [Bordetella avium 197N]|uniref:Phage protein n=1 Tax=Bordetella avium (strain 197N) TaxID=360910 RepID=Q2L2F2_BORA1|nr:putative phage protein [Bordetella avium 197N]
MPNADTTPAAAGLGPASIAALQSGDQAAVYRVLWLLAGNWLERGGSFLKARHTISASMIAGRAPTQAAFLAAGCDLYDLLAQIPQGRQALHDLLAKPVTQEAKGE